MFPLPEPADLVIASHFTFDDISSDITTLETKLKGTVCVIVLVVHCFQSLFNSNVNVMYTLH